MEPAAERREHLLSRDKPGQDPSAAMEPAAERWNTIPRGTYDPELGLVQRRPDIAVDVIRRRQLQLPFAALGQELLPYQIETAKPLRSPAGE
jgi:hypothetical protein